jgi:hypothetical protein
VLFSSFVLLLAFLHRIVALEGFGKEVLECLCSFHSIGCIGLISPWRFSLMRVKKLITLGLLEPEACSFGVLGILDNWLVLPGS